MLPRLYSHTVFFALAFFSLVALQSAVYAQKTDARARYIVQLSEDAMPLGEASSPAMVASIAAELSYLNGATHERTYSAAIKGFTVLASPASADLLAKDPRVKAVQKDLPITAAATQSAAPWGLDRIDQRNLPLRGNYNYDQTGAGVNVYVIDSGIRGTHTEFAGRVNYVFDAINDGQNGNDCLGHGTHVAGTIGGATYGVAKNVTLNSMRVLDCTGNGAVSGLLDAIDWVTANRQGPSVVNISITINAVVSIIDDAINTSVASGITYVIAAANNGQDACNFSPARAADAITVGATGSTDLRGGYSNFGPCVDIFAPGSGIYSAGIASDTAVAGKSGTSMAAPHVAGAVALLLESDPTLSPAEATQILVDTATEGVLGNLGTGSPDKMLYLGFNDTAPGTISSISPSGGMAFVGSEHMISWNNRGDYNSRVTIELSTDGGNTFTRTIADGAENNGTFQWNVPYTPTAQARIRVRESGREMPVAESSSQFVITLAPTAAVTTISGRVADTDGTAILRATVQVTAPDGTVYSAVTNTFGYFTIAGVPVGRDYILAAYHRRYSFQPVHIPVADETNMIEIRAGS
jgi:subtilisin family serine protease